jgi:hypothetical protein
MEAFAMFAGDGFQDFRKKIIQNGNAENEVCVMLHPKALYDEISSCKISLWFSAFSLPRTFQQKFRKCLTGSSFRRI